MSEDSITLTIPAACAKGHPYPQHVFFKEHRREPGRWMPECRRCKAESNARRGTQPKVGVYRAPDLDG